MPNTLRVLLTVFAVACAGSTSETEQLLPLLQRRIEDRKAAASAGDSVGWLRAAELHENAICVDATGAKRACRPDFGAPTQWRQRSVLDSVAIARIGNSAVITYRQTDTVLVADNLAIGRARYVETYQLEAGRWRLIALTEATIPEPRVAVSVPGSVLRPYVGTYGSAAYELRVTMRDGLLHLAGPGEAPAALHALSSAQFFATGDVGTYEFRRADGANPDELRYHHQSHTYRFPRRR